MGSPAISPTSTFADWTDSHYQYVKTRILAINPTRIFSGIVDASDWPSLQIVPGSYYLVTSTLDPTRPSDGPGSNSWYSPLYGEQVQWAWSLIGDDIPANALAANRTKYRYNQAIIQEVLQGCSPGFCEKLRYSTEGTDLIATSYVPSEYIWFTKPRFSTRIERSTGTLFGSASVNISGFAPIIS